MRHPNADRRRADAVEGPAARRPTAALTWRISFVAWRMLEHMARGIVRLADAVQASRRGRAARPPSRRRPSRDVDPAPVTLGHGCPGPVAAGTGIDGKPRSVACCPRRASAVPIGSAAEPADWSMLVIGVLGGDHREQEIARRAAATGAEVRALGFPWPDAGMPGVVRCDHPAAVLNGATVAILPTTSAAPDGAMVVPAAAGPIVLDRAMLAGMARGAHLVLGRADPALTRHARALGIAVHEHGAAAGPTIDRIPAIVSDLLRRLVDGSDGRTRAVTAGVVGLGPVGTALTRCLMSHGIRTHAAAGDPDDRLAAFEAGASPCRVEDLPALAPRLDLVVATLVSPIVDAGVLARLPEAALVVDLAGPPGSVDYEVAAVLGRTVIRGRELGLRPSGTLGAGQWEAIRTCIAAIVRERASIAAPREA